MNSFKFNKSDYQFILIYFFGTTIWLLYRWNVEDYTLFEISTGLPGFVIKNLMLLYIFRWLINEFLVVRKNYVVFILLAFVAWEGIGFLDMWRDYYTSDHHWELPSFGVMLVQNFNRAAIDSVMLIGLILGKKYYENKLENIELQNTQKELELKVLRSQFNPHFLYNCLNTIDALVDYSPKKKVKEYISNLSGLYRYLIAAKDEDIATLEAEIALAKNYCYLTETQFENDYKFIIPNHHHYKDKFLPNGALLTALENVVKHNKPTSNKCVVANIRINQNEVKVSNTISKNQTNESLGTGLINLKKRYQLLSDKTIKIKQTDQEFVITMPLLSIVD